MVRTFLQGEITPRSTAPLHLYFLSKANDEKLCLFTEIKSMPFADILTSNESDKVLDESFSKYHDFMNLVNKPTPPPPTNPKAVRTPFANNWRKAHDSIVGASISGLCAAYELKRLGGTM
jgi:hypothetical protein